MKRIIVLFVLIFIAAASLMAYSDSISKDLESGLVRLHIVANSDSKEDQAIKLMVRDACLAEMRNSLKSAPDKDNPTDTALLTDTANHILSANNAPYRAEAVSGKMYFPEKEYKNMTLPSGEYNGVKIILGNGEGHNWWCVLYPPMCVLDDGGTEMSEEAKKILRKNLNPETYDVITKNGRDAVVKFKIVELVKQLLPNS